MTNFYVQSRMVWLLEHPRIQDAMWKMLWNYPFITDFCVHSRMVWFLEHLRVQDAIWKM